MRTPPPAVPSPALISFISSRQPPLRPPRAQSFPTFVKRVVACFTFAGALEAEEGEEAIALAIDGGEEHIAGYEAGDAGLGSAAASLYVPYESTAGTRRPRTHFVPHTRLFRPRSWIDVFHIQFLTIIRALGVRGVCLHSLRRVVRYAFKCWGLSADYPGAVEMLR